MSWFPSKKIITTVSSILAIGILIHLIGVYLYKDGRFEGMQGGSLSIGIVDVTPSPMNPFQYGKDSSADFVYRLLFRSLIRYDIRDEVYTGDLANCDLSDTSSIKCTLRDDALWSDGSKVVAADVIGTIDTFRKRAPSDKMRGFLEGVTVKQSGDTLEIRSSTKNNLMIDLLTYPIVRTDMIDRISTERVTANTYITSGPFIFGDTATDKTYGFDRITLLRNEKWKGEVWLDKIHFKFFSKFSDLISASESLSVIIPPPKNERIELGPRFREYTYSGYEYFGMFLNTKTLGKTLRNALHWQLGTTLANSISGESKPIETFFSTGGQILPNEKQKNFPDIMRELGYQKKIDLIASLEKSGSLVSGEAKFDAPKYWTNAANSTTIFIDDTTPEVLLSGKTPAGTKSVTINEYTLQEFDSGSSKFIYRVKLDGGTLKEGKNTYHLVLSLNDGKTLTEDLTLYWSADKDRMITYKNQVRDEYNATQNTPALIAERDRKKAEQVEKIRTLSDEFYYNSKLEPMSLKVGYSVGPQGTESLAQSTEKSLRLLGIQAELIPYTPKDLQNIITTGEKKYDLLLTGLSVEGSIANIGQFFSSSTTNAKINFANYSNKTLDELFAKLKANTNSDDIDTIEADIVKIMKADSFFFPISSPLHRIYIDKNIKGIPTIPIIPDIPSFASVFAGTSIKEHYIRGDNKSIGGFFSWIRSQLSW